MNPYLHILRKVESLTGERIPLQYPSKKGDVSFPVGFVLSKKKGGDPETLAEEVAHSLEDPLIERVEVEKGYINVYFDRETFVRRVFDDVLSSSYGSSDERRTIVIDYSSPNIAKPMHVGHLRSTILGESLKRILRWRGNNVIGLNYLGDIGTQFGSLIVAYKRWVDKKKLEEDPIKELLRIYVKFHEEVEKDPALEEEARRVLELLEKGEKEYVELWKHFKDLSLKGFERIYSRLGVEFDIIVGESDFIEDARKISYLLLEKGVAFKGTEGEKKDAIVADLEKEGLNHPVLLKSDGTTIYLSRDLASLLWRIEKFSPHSLIYVVALEQNLHFKQLFSLARKLGIEQELVHLSFGMVHVEGMRLSTRRGNVVFLEDILNKAVEYTAEEMKKRGTYNPSDAEKIGISSVIFWMLKVEPKKDVTFRWKELTSFTGETGPYVQYAYVRSKHILEKASKEMRIMKPNDEEWTIVKQLAYFPLVLEEISKRYTPHLLARYLLSLSSSFHHFYDHERVLGHPREDFRLWMVKGVNNVLKIGQHLLAMKPPSVM